MLASGWINGAGPFVFVIDTGAGICLLKRDAATRGRLVISKSNRPLVGGLSGSSILSDEETRVSGIALGDPNNLLPAAPAAALVSDLPGGIDGILNPTELFGSLGYSVDLPNGVIQTFDPGEQGLRLDQTPAGGTVVRWVRERGGNRPFVKLGDGRLALIDTGSGLGLAYNDASATIDLKPGDQTTIVHDLGGGTIQVRRIEPVTVSIGELELRKVPTDVLVGRSRGTSVILGRRALDPFKITFDPVARLIAIEPSLRR